MAATFALSWDASRDPIFRENVEMAMLKVATMVIGEATSDAGSTGALVKRHDFSIEVLRGQHVDQMIKTVAASNVIIDSTSSDNDIEFQVSAVWSDFAGVGAVGGLI